MRDVVIVIDYHVTCIRMNLVLAVSRAAIFGTIFHYRALTELITALKMCSLGSVHMTPAGCFVEK